MTRKRYKKIQKAIRNIEFQEQLVKQFEPSWCLEAYQALRDGTAVGDEGYIKKIRGRNKVIISQLRDYVISGVLSANIYLYDKDIIVREKAATILGELRKISLPEESTFIKSILERRAKIEPEGCVLERIESFFK